MHRSLTPHTWMHRNRHPSSKCSGILPPTHECTEIIIPHVNAPKSYPWHMNTLKSQSSRKCIESQPLKRECTDIMIHNQNAQESYPSHMNAPKSSLLGLMLRNPTPHTWMHRNRHPASKCTGILPLTHECTEIVIPQVNAPESYPSLVNTTNSWSLK